MSNDYFKIGKIYSLSSTVNVSISGASFILGINNNHSAAIVVTVDGIAINLAVNASISFPVPVAFSTVRINTGTAIIFYS